MDKYAELRAALAQTCHALLIDDPDTIRALLAERDALLDQHHRDSKELRRLCAQRDAARKVSKEAGAVIAGLKAEMDALREVLVYYVSCFEQHNITNTHGARDFDFTGQIADMARAALAQGES